MDMEKIYIVWKNGAGCELHRRVAENDEDVKTQLIAMITEGDLCVNDTLTIVLE
jgi:hypothetical protein